MTEFLTELFKARVITSWDADTESQLSIRKDQIVSVLKLSETGWWFVENPEDESTGWSPSNFMQKMNPNTDTDICDDERKEIGDIGFDPFPSLPFAPEGEGCDVCFKVLPLEFVLTNGHKYHRECFCCNLCHAPLKSSSYVLNDGRLFCQKDFHQVFGPHCACCGEGIVGIYKEALGKKWKPEHLVCVECKQPFESGEFFHKDGEDELFCKAHFYDRYASQCDECHKYIDGKCYKVGDLNFHLECFFCSWEHEKHLITEGSAYHEKDGKLFCTEHFMEMTLERCQRCHNFMEKDYINFHSLKFHPFCFNCETCDTSLLKQYFGYFEGHLSCTKCIKNKHSSKTPLDPLPERQSPVHKSFALKKGLKIDTGADPKGPPSGWYKPKSGRRFGKEAGESTDQKVEFEFVPNASLPSHTSFLDAFKVAPKPKTLKLYRSNEPVAATVVDLKESSSETEAGEADICLSEDEYPDWPYEDLKGKDVKLPDGVDARFKEKYLSAVEFLEIFGVTRSEFDAFPLWKRKKLKQKFDLF